MTIADDIREHVKKNYIDPARRRSERTVTFKASDIHRAMGLQNHFPSVCQAIDSDKFIDFASVTLFKRTGPPKSSSVRWTYDLLPDRFGPILSSAASIEDRNKITASIETSIINKYEPVETQADYKTTKAKSDALTKLLDLSFEDVGSWSLDGDGISFTLNKSANEANILYSFVVNGEVKYIGKSIQTLYRRMYLYKQGGGSQITNIRNKKEIKTCLERGSAVRIYVFVPQTPMEHKGILVNVAAGLEDNLISLLRPEWNKR